MYLDHMDLATNKAQSDKISEVGCFECDKPINLCALDELNRPLDELNRRPFADALLNVIRGYKGQDCIVLALYGAWGTGKTSILKTVKAQLDSSETDGQTILFCFNPWNFSGQNQLISQFFEQLKKQFDELEKAGAKYKQILATLSGIGSKLLLYSKTIAPLLSLIPIPGMEAVKGVIGVMAGVQEQKEESLTLATQKKDLDDCFKKLTDIGARMLIVMDDIDRMSNVEIRQVFQLVKLFADFPSTIYLLAFDRDVVVRALEEVQQGSGLAYLKKVIQASFEVPPSSDIEIERILYQRILEMAPDIEEATRRVGKGYTTVD